MDRSSLQIEIFSKWKLNKGILHVYALKKDFCYTKRAVIYFQGKETMSVSDQVRFSLKKSKFRLSGIATFILIVTFGAESP